MQVHGAQFDSMKFVNYESFVGSFVEDRKSKFKYRLLMLVEAGVNRNPSALATAELVGDIDTTRTVLDISV